MTEQNLDWKNIQCLILDVDGICTSGHLHYTEKGESIKIFNVLDGHGIKSLLSKKINVAIISGRKSKIVTNRFSELGVEWIYQGQTNKLPAYNEILKKLNLTSDQVAYMGDDLPDAPLIEKSHIGITVPNAHCYIRKIADIICKKNGGDGAVREISDLILAAHNKKE